MWIRSWRVIQMVRQRDFQMVMDWRFPRLREKAKDWLKERGTARGWLTRSWMAIRTEMLRDLTRERGSLTPEWRGSPKDSLVGGGVARDSPKEWLMERGMATDSPIPKWMAIPRD